MVAGHGAMPRLDVYIPSDRRRAIAAGTALPDRAEGAALFVDLSGFTTLTETLGEALGERVGAQELARQLNRMYDALIAEVDWHAGSVLGFSGDGITCWFDDTDGPGAARATASALAMQQAMGAFTRLALPHGQATSMAMRAGVASGRVGRFLVGDPSLQLLDVIAGTTVARMAAAASLARPGELVVDAATASRLGDGLEVRAWRASPSAERMALVSRLARGAAPAPPAVGQLPPLSETSAGPWLLPEIRDRQARGLEQTLMELRPVVVLFCQFEGIDYDDGRAGSQLESYVRRAQRVLAAYGGALLQLAFDDKGSHFYASFGAPTAHEDDARRAVSAARELQAPSARGGEGSDGVQPARIGISRGLMHAGAYGGRTRRTYGVLGDEVNVAARLMERAAPGEVLASERVWRAARGFAWEPRPPVLLKGKQQPLQAARLLDEEAVRTVPAGPAPMMGRGAELDRLLHLMAPIFEGRLAGLVRVQGEPGMGKTRLALAVRERLGAERDASWFTCPADGLRRRSLHPFRQFLREHGGCRPALPESVSPTQIAAAKIDGLVDGLLESLRSSGLGKDEDGERLAVELNRVRPFLAALAGASSDEVQELAHLTPELLFENQLAAFKTLLVAECRRRPVVLHVEDAHWLDEDSIALLERLLRNVADVPLAVLLTSRDGDEGTSAVVDVDESVTEATIDLRVLPDAEVRRLAGFLLGGEIGDALAAFLVEKTGGNPFFVEQLALDLRERRGLRGENAAWELATGGRAELPTDLNAVLIARLDRLAAPVKEVVQVAAVLGREFEVQVLSAVLTGEAVRRAIEEAEAARIWTALSPVRYLFRHALLRDAAYSMQVEARVRELHARAASAIETLHASEVDDHAADLAFHHARAGNLDRERQYAALAGKAAAARFANPDAIAYFSRALTLTPSEAAVERFQLLKARQEVHALQGSWMEQAADLDALEDLAERLDDDCRRADVAGLRARHANAINDHPAALAAARRAIALARAAGDVQSELVGFSHGGSALRSLGEYADARAYLERGLALARSTSLPAIEAALLSNLGVVLDLSCERDAAEACFEQDLAIHRELGDPVREANALMHLGTMRFRWGDSRGARDRFEQALRLSRQVGNRQVEYKTLGNLGMLSRDFDPVAARSYAEHGLRLALELGDRYGEGHIRLLLGSLGLDRGDYVRARAAYESALATSRAIGDRQNEGVVLSSLGKLALDTGLYDGDCDRDALRLAREIGDRDAEVVALCNLARLAQRLGNLPAALQGYQEALETARAIDNRDSAVATLVGRGYVLGEAGRASEAEDSFREGLEIARALNAPVQVAEAGAGLASIFLARGRVREALEVLEPLHLGSEALPHGRAEPFAPDLTWIRVLRANGDLRWRPALAAAHARLREAASSLPDRESREAYLHAVPVHRAIEREWEEAGGG